jgi:hypothetical protein
MKNNPNDIRTLLGKVRKLQESDQQIGSLDSDDIKKLLDEQKKPKLTVNQKWRLLTEEEEVEIKISDEKPQEVTPDEQREEENKFKDIVSKLVKFGTIKVYKQNVEWSGELVREKIKWVFSLNENNGCYVSIESQDMLPLTNEVIETIKKLKGYYDAWSDEWSSRLTGTPTTGGEGEGTAAPEPGNEGGGGTEAGGGFEF